MIHWQQTAGLVLRLPGAGPAVCPGSIGPLNGSNPSTGSMRRKLPGNTPDAALTCREKGSPQFLHPPGLTTEPGGPAGISLPRDTGRDHIARFNDVIRHFSRLGRIAENVPQSAAGMQQRRGLFSEYRIVLQGVVRDFAYNTSDDAPDSGTRRHSRLFCSSCPASTGDSGESITMDFMNRAKQPGILQTGSPESAMPEYHVNTNRRQP